MATVSRRSFLKTAGLLTTAAAFSAKSWAQVAGANGDIRHAVIGLNGRGKNHIEGFQKVSGVRLVALCDADTAVLDKTNEALKISAIQDVRQLLEHGDIDTVSIATPNHWHSLMAIWAVQAGKDVYVEKPVSHNVWEGRQLVLAAQKTGRVVQAGTQCRSNPGISEALSWLRAGNLGKVTVSRGLCYKRRDSIGQSGGPVKIPSTVDFDLWAGPSPKVPPHRTKFHYDWHWFWDTGNGDLGNQGIHQVDLARWFLGESGMPRHVWSVGGRVGYVDDGQTANTQVIVYDYPTAPMVFEVRGLPSASTSRKMDELHGASIGLIVECEGGKLVIPSYTEATAFDKDGKVVKHFEGEKSHFQNFIDGVRARSSAGLNGPILEGHVSSALCHLGNISHRMGAVASQGEIREKVKGDKAIAEAFGRMSEHLEKNGLKPAETSLTLGELLPIEPGTEHFSNNPEADKLLTRQYRAPYVVPTIA